MYICSLFKDMAYLRNQDLVTRLYAWGDPLAILVNCSRSNSENLGFIQLLHRSLGKEDTGCGLGLGLDALNEDAVEERSNGTD